MRYIPRMVVLALLGATLAACGGGEPPTGSGSGSCAPPPQVTTGEQATYTFHYSSGVVHTHEVTVESSQVIVVRQGDTVTRLDLAQPCNDTGTGPPPPATMTPEQAFLIYQGGLDPAADGAPSPTDPQATSPPPTLWHEVGCRSETLALPGAFLAVSTCDFVSDDGTQTFSESRVHGTPAPLGGMVRYMATNATGNSVIVELTDWNGL